MLTSLARTKQMKQLLITHFFYHNMNQSLVLTFYLNCGLTNLYFLAENYPVLNSSDFFCWQINKETLFIVLG